MRKGTTPTFTFELEKELSPELIANAKFMLNQQGVKLTKTLKDGNLEGNRLSWKLSQEETLLFNDNAFCYAQLQIITILGDSFVSDIHQVYVSEYLDNEVLA